jgi:glycosyltransferase involved in cell wall biosynthesis
MTRPFVSVVTPTYNRREFLPILIHLFQVQTYPPELRELVIIDDSPSSNEDLIPKDDKSIRYIYLPEKITLGEKRNRLNKEAKGEIIVCFDDDDYHYPERISYSVCKLNQDKTDIAGCTIMDVYYTDTSHIFRYGPFGSRHGSNGTFAYRKKYVENHSHDNTRNAQEEPSFTNNFTERMTQLDPEKIILCISHNYNTYDKRILLRQEKLERKIKLKKLIRDKVYLDFLEKTTEKHRLEMELNKKLEDTKIDKTEDNK